MNEIRKDQLRLFKPFAAHQNIQIATIDKKGSFATQERTVILKKLDIAELTSEKLKKYHQEGRIAFILDGHHIHFNKTFADSHLIELGLSHLSVKLVPRKASHLKQVEEMLENVSVQHLDQEEYDEMINILDTISKAQKKESDLQGKVKASCGTYNSAARLALKHLLLKNILNEMSEISRRFIESIQKNMEEESEARKVDAKKQQDLKQRLTQERLAYETNKNEIESTGIKKRLGHEDIVSDDKRASLSKKTGMPIAERQS